MAKNKYFDEDGNEGEDKWKAKYFSSIEELEQKEQLWQRDDKILRSLIIELSSAADSSSEKLNKQLSVLKDAISDGIAASKLKKAIDEVSESVTGLHRIQEKNRSLPQKNLLELISKTKPAGKIEKKLNKISAKISKAKPGQDVSPYINDLARLFVHGLSLANKKKEKGILSSLLERGSEDEKQGTILIDEEEAESHFKETQNHGEQGQDTISSQNEEVSQDIRLDSDVLPEEKEIIEKSVIIEQEIEEELTNAIASLNSLLEKMILPADLQVEANLVKRKLAEGVDEEGFISSLEQTVEIIAEVLERVRREKQEIEEFLKQLTGRLHELDSDIRETARISELTHQHGIQLTDGMKDEMSVMEDGINSINNLEELKTAIQSRVIILRDHVDNFILKEGEKNREANEVINQLKQQVEQMENETKVLKEQIEEERKQTLRDVLTEIPNRLAYTERLELALADFRRNKDPFVLVVWDIDYFKKVNDTYGHSAGDQVLKLVASIINKNMRETDFIARYGGEEFVSLLPGTDLEGAKLLTNKLRILIESSNFHFREQPVKITVSGGYAEVREDEKGESLFARADEALYKAKENGRNQCQAAN